MKTCIHCGAELPAEANLCPVCGAALTESKVVKPSVFPRRKISIAAAVLAILFLVFFAVRAVHAPKIYDDGGSELSYTDKTGTYLILASWSGGNSVQRQSVQDWTSKLEDEMQSSQPCKLFVYDPVTDANLQESFLEKIRSAELSVTRQDGQPTDIYYTEPAYNENFPQAALESDLIYTANSGANEIVWTLHMENGDTLVLHQTFTAIRLLRTVYTAENTPLNTMEELTALLEQIWETDGSNTIATIYLPPVTYEGELNLENRAYNLVGSSEAGKRTTFTGTISVNSQDPQASTFDNMVIEGSGSGVGISATKMVVVQNSELRGWDIAAFARQGSWVGISQSIVEENRIGLQFDSNSSRGMMALFENNTFRNNQTAILLLDVPGSFPLTFTNTVFSGNQTDIDNQANYPLDTQDAIFEP